MASTYTIQVLDGTNDISALIDPRSFDLIMVLTKEKGTCSFDILTPKAPTLPTNFPILGDTIYVNYTINGNTQKIFGGTVVTIETVVDGGILQRAKITCADWGFKFDSKLVYKTYQNMDPQDIVKDIVANFAPAGFTTTHVQKGNFLVASIKFNYEQPTKALAALATQIGWDWYIDPNKDIHFFFAGNAVGSTEYQAAPFNIDDTNGNLDWATLDVEEDISNMQNSIYVVGGTYTKTFATPAVPGISYSPVDIYTSVAGTFVYPLNFAYDIGTMSITLGGVAQTIGTDQQTPDSSVQVQYNNTARTIRFTSDPGSGSSINVQGKARIPILAHLTNPSAVATYGELQHSVIDQQIKSVLEAQERANALITQFGHPTYDVKFTSVSDLANQLYIGQMILLNSTKFGVSNYPLIIKRIEARSHARGSGANPMRLDFQVEAIGSDSVTFNDIMLNLLQQVNAQTVTPDNTVLELILTFSETITVSDTIIVTHAGAPYGWDNAATRADFYTLS